jgi:hypothetical protein
MPRGGARPNSGPKKGTKYKPTLEKAAAREHVRQYLSRKLDHVSDALVSRSVGVRYFVTRNKKTGKFEMVTDPERVIKALNAEGDESGEFYTAIPDTAAIRELFDRTLDRAPQPVKVGGDEDAGPIEVRFSWQK